jgi:serine/threonine protein kinase
MVSASEDRSADPLLGQLVDGRFEIEALLGSGSVGSVYRARDRTRGGRNVALKIWNGTTLNEQTRGRFVREAKALTTLRHPNIVDVQSFGMFDKLPYVAMEYLDGQPLEASLTGEPLEFDFAFDVIGQMLQALAYAHELGVVHRDLKPDNVVLLRRDDGSVQVKLLDYGLAKFLSPDDDPVQGRALTMTGMVMGTPLYMAPEQAAGKSIDGRVDVYAVGCILFEMLVGRPPFYGENNAEIFRAHMVTPTPRIAELRNDPAAGPALQEFFERALAKQPEARFAHAGEMLLALQALPRPASRRKPEPALGLKLSDTDRAGPRPGERAALAGAGKADRVAPRPAARTAVAGGGMADRAAPSFGERSDRASADGPEATAAPDNRAAPRSDAVSAASEPGSDRMPLMAALITGLCTAAALAWALLH